MTYINNEKIDSILQTIWKNKVGKALLLGILAALLFFISILAIKAIKGYPVKMLGFEVNNKQKTDTIYIFIHDTIKLTKSSNITTIKQDPVNHVEAKKTDSSTSKYHLTGPFNGPTQIGENNIQNNYGKLDRHLNGNDKVNLLKRLNALITENNIAQSTTIELAYPVGQEEAMNFATEVALFLNSQGYNMSNTIGTTMGNLHKGFWIAYLEKRIFIDVGGSQKP